MALKEVLLLGDPRLYEVCEPVRQGEMSELESVVTDLHDTLMDCQQHIGAGRPIAAPQIGVMKRLVYMNIDGVLAVARAIDGQSFRLRSQVP